MASHLAPETPPPPPESTRGIDFASLCSLESGTNSITTRFLAPIDCYKIPEPERVIV
jgi:hypothetical protein